MIEQIGGTQAGQFGSLAVTGAATLAGTLGVDQRIPAGSGGQYFVSIRRQVSGNSAASSTPLRGAPIPSAPTTRPEYRKRRGHRGALRRPGGHPDARPQPIGGRPAGDRDLDGDEPREHGHHGRLARRRVPVGRRTDRCRRHPAWPPSPKATPPLAANGSYQASASFTVPVGHRREPTPCWSTPIMTSAEPNRRIRNNVRLVSVSGVAAAARPARHRPGRRSVERLAVGRHGDGRLERQQRGRRPGQRQLVRPDSPWSTRPPARRSSIPTRRTAATAFPRAAARRGRTAYAAQRGGGRRPTEHHRHGRRGQQTCWSTIPAARIDTNRSANITAQSTLAPYPDLVAGAVSAPATTVVGQPVTVSWTDVNQGTAAATGHGPTGSIVYASPTGTDPTFVGSATFSGTLPAGQSTPQSATVTLPLNLVGTYYFGVTADYLDQVIEAGTPARRRFPVGDADRGARSGGRVGATGRHDAQFGQQLSVTWTVNNAGNGPATGDWSDQVVPLAAKRANAGATLLLTQAESAKSPLAAGGGYTQTAQVTLPLTCSFRARQLLSSSSRSTGQASPGRPRPATTRPPAAISLALTPAARTGGQHASWFQPGAGRPGIQRRSWNDQNNGAATASGAWIDKVYLSIDQNAGPRHAHRALPLQRLARARAIRHADPAFDLPQHGRAVLHHRDHRRRRRHPGSARTRPTTRTASTTSHRSLSRRHCPTWWSPASRRRTTACSRAPRSRSRTPSRTRAAARPRRSRTGRI